MKASFLQQTAGIGGSKKRNTLCVDVLRWPKAKTQLLVSVWRLGAADRLISLGHSMPSEEYHQSSLSERVSTTWKSACKPDQRLKYSGIRTVFNRIPVRLGLDLNWETRVAVRSLYWPIHRIWVAKG